MVLMPCEKCGKLRKFRYIKHNNSYKNYKELCAICSPNNRKYITKNDFINIDTPEKAYSFGFFWADGCINRYKTFTVRVHQKDKDVVDFFHSYFGGIRTQVTQKRKDGRKYIQEEWIIHDVNFINSLKLKQFRLNIKCIPKKFFKDFLRGLIDGDGYYKYINERLNSISISSNYEDNFEWLIEKIKIPFRLSKNITKTGKSSTLFLKGGHNKLQQYVKWIYKDASCYLKRKKDLNINLLTT